MTTRFGDFGAPPDAVAWAALAFALVLAAFSVAPTTSPSLFSRVRSGEGPHFSFTVALLALGAGVFSAGYVAHYLRGGPRIIDATSYFLEARALSQGHVAFPIPEPSGSFRGRFLLSSEDARSLSVIFPPGYPLLLALGFLVHAPMLVGPLIAVGLVVVTAALAVRLFVDRRVALLAASLSVVCAVLRYHTADTMSHGWSAFLLAITLLSSLDSRASSPWVAGASAGLLAATRPMSGLVALFLALLSVRQSPARLLRVAFSAFPPILLFLAEQRVATGVWFGSTQLSYYALADSPPGCFRYGFGAGIGCRVEHGDFVRAHLAHGFGALAAAGTTLRRLKMHLADAANAELFAPVLVYALWSALRSGKGRLAALGVLGIVLVYVPFYFDGNYPGGGARLFSDALPLEHVLLAGSLVRFGLARLALPVSLLGFALHTSYDHRKLAEREGGRPLFEARVLANAGVKAGLVFVDTDHGFSLGYDPSVVDAHQGVVVARRRHDAHDTVLWEALGRPRAFSYETTLTGALEQPRLVPLPLPLASLDRFRFEAEAEWPPLALRGGSVLPVFPPCASGRRALRLEPASGSLVPLRMTLELAVSRPGRYRLITGWASGEAGVAATISVGGATESILAPVASGPCLVLLGPAIEIPKQSEFMEISVNFPHVLDYLELTPEP